MEKAMSNTEMTYCEYDFESFRRYISDEVLREGRPGEIKKFFFEGDAGFQKKMEQAKNYIKKLNEGECVEMIYDDTISGNGHDGMVLTNQRIIDTYMNKYVDYYVRLEDVVDIIPMEKTHVIVKGKNKELKIPCTGSYEVRLIFARELKDLLHL